MTDVKKKIILYSADWCEPCKKLKTELDVMLKDRNDVDVVVIDIEKNPAEQVLAVPRVCLIIEDIKKCDGISDCLEGYDKVNMDKIRKFVEG
jgi:thiol-disulfide isomerase/thioredoxin